MLSFPTTVVRWRVILALLPTYYAIAFQPHHVGVCWHSINKNLDISLLQSSRIVTSPTKYGQQLLLLHGRKTTVKHLLSSLLPNPSTHDASPPRSAQRIIRYNQQKKSSVRAKKKPIRSKPQGFAGALRNIQLTTFQYSGSMRPGKQSPQRTVNTPGIMLPDYALDGQPKNTPRLLPWIIEVKSADQIEKMRAAGRVAREVLDIAGRAVLPGVTTDEIDTLVHDETIKRGAYPSPLNYHGFPKSCCTSVNEIICHGIPDDRKLREGDIVNIDITCYLNGYHGDCSEMFIAGDNADEKAKDLLQVTYDSWISAMNFCKPGRDYKDIGGIIEDYVVEHGYTTVRNFCGHGVGGVFHTTPNVLHYRNNEPNGQMAVGHTFTIEPMICEGMAKCLTWPDEWTAATLDGKRTAQFEHTLLLTPDGVEPLTGKLPTSPVQFFEKNSKIHQGIWLGTSESASRASAAA